jgi:CarD family transcriptional regulator
MATKATARRPRLKLEVGEKAVCPPHGVAEVVAIEDDEISGAKETYYRMRIRHRRMRMMIPVRKAEAIGLRPLISSEAVEQVLSILKRRPRRVTGPWPRMCRDLHAKLHSGSIFDAAEVARDLTWTKKRKELSASAQRILDTALELVITELAAASGRDEEVVEKQVEAALRLPRAQPIE